MARVEVPDGPAAPPMSMPHGLSALEVFLSNGWQIDPPVLARPSWAKQHSGELAYHFILIRGTRRSLVVVADSDELRHFLAEHALAVA